MLETDTLHDTINPSVQRELLLTNWLNNVLPEPVMTIEPLLGDASFRQYSRITVKSTTYMLMDAPPEAESCTPFVDIATTYSKLGLKVPQIYAQDIANGFLLLTDFGDTLYANRLNTDTADALYKIAMEDILRVQTCRQEDGYHFPAFDEAEYRQELSMFTEWYASAHLQVTFSQQDKRVINDAFSHMIEVAMSQPQCCVHRDFHCRNLMVLPNNEVGILDFQDAVWGPVTYDLVSLLRDCYIDWPEPQVWGWVDHFQQRLLDSNLLQEENPQTFRDWFDWVGLQRNLKCIGLFPRLCHRDHKPNYLQYMPRILNYAKQVCSRHASLQDFGAILNRLIDIKA